MPRRKPVMDTARWRRRARRKDHKTIRTEGLIRKIRQIQMPMTKSI